MIICYNTQVNMMSSLPAKNQLVSIYSLAQGNAVPESHRSGSMMVDPS